MLWFASCCARHERAEKVDKWMKYSSSIVVSFSLLILCCYGIQHQVPALTPFLQHARQCSHQQSMNALTSRGLGCMQLSRCESTQGIVKA